MHKKHLTTYLQGFSRSSAWKLDTPTLTTWRCEGYYSCQNGHLHHAQLTAEEVRNAKKHVIALVQILRHVIALVQILRHVIALVQIMRHTNRVSTMYFKMQAQSKAKSISLATYAPKGSVMWSCLR